MRVNFWRGRGEGEGEAEVGGVQDRLPTGRLMRESSGSIPASAMYHATCREGWFRSAESWETVKYALETNRRGKNPEDTACRVDGGDFRVPLGDAEEEEAQGEEHEEDDQRD